MSSDKVKKGLAAGMLAGFLAVAAAVALTAASPAPAPADSTGTAAEKAASGAQGALAGEQEKSSEPDETVPSNRAYQSTASVSQTDLSDTQAVSNLEERSDSEPDADQGNVTTAESPSGGQQAGSPRPADGAKERRWVVDYEMVWVPSVETVVDVPEHEEPIYESRDVLVCNACGYRSESGNAMGPHLSQHAAQGVDEGYCSVIEQVQVGTRTVPAVCHEVDNGHYERREAGGHWE